MAEKFVSPGVFTEEFDQTFLPQGVDQIGAVIIGPFLKGPAFTPVLVDSPNKAIQLFGTTSEKFYTQYAAQSYLKNAPAYLIRTLWDEGYTLSNDVIAPINLGTYSAGTYATTSMSFTEISHSAILSVTSSLTEDKYQFIATGSGFADVGNVYYYETGSSLTLTINNLVDKMNSKLDFIEVTRSAADTFIVSSSVIGTDYNSSTFTSASVIGTLSGGTDASGDNIVALLAPTANESVSSISITGSKTALLIDVVGTKNYSYTASLLETSDDYIGNLFGTNPQGKKPIYVYSAFPEFIAASAETVVSKNTQVTMDFEYDAGDQYRTAETPWITSQEFGGETYNLLKFVSRTDGTYGNKEIKVSITDIRKPGTISGTDYGTFTVIVREWDDSDIRPVVLETFNSVNLDPTSTQYIGRIIGDRYTSFTTDLEGNPKIVYVGDYENVSNYIRVEVESDISDGSITANAIPFGFGAVKTPIKGGTLPTASFVTTQTANGEFNSKVPFGFDFSLEDNKQYLAPLPDKPVVGDNVAFNLGDMVDNDGNTITVDSNTKYKKFIVPLQGGFDGTDPAQQINTGENITSANIMGFDCSSGTSSGTVVYKKALDIVANPQEIDVKLLCIPGITISKHPSVYNYANNICIDRQDCFYLADLDIKGTNVANAITLTTGLDTNYAGTYYPWLKIKDQNTNRFVWVPPSVEMLGVMGFNDNVAYEWYAPAGFNRGGLTNVVETEVRLNSAELNALYENRINPINSFPREGIVAWGQKTLQAKPSSLDRINVRRLLINLKKYIASTSKYLVFEQNTDQTREKFLNIVNPYMESVKQKRGIYSFIVRMDETNNTPETIDRNILYGAIYIQPAKAVEFIQIDFNLTPTGATFEDI